MSSAVATASVVDLAFTPRPWQDACFRGFTSRSVVVVHRRGGKTVMAIMRLVDAALRNGLTRPRYAYIAPLLKQAKGIAWDYLKAYARKVPGTIINEGELWVEFPNAARIRIYGADNPDGLRGLYFDGVVIDEVAQIKKELWTEVLVPTLNDRKGWALFIGTPKGINLFSKLYYEAQNDPLWFTASFNCYQTGELTDEELKAIKDQQGAAVFRQEYLCDFTASSANNLISIEDVIAAQRRHFNDSEFEFAAKILGIDVAWQGGDRNTIFARQGVAAFAPLVAPEGMTQREFAGMVARVIVQWKPDAVFVDTTGGYGGELVSRLREWGHAVNDVVFSWKAGDERFANIRAEMWFRMADWLKSGAIPSERCAPGLQAELCAPTFSNDNASNRFQLESKDDIRARVGVSPDLADALALTFAFPVARANPFGKPAQAVTAFDPYRAEPETPAQIDFDPFRWEDR